MGGSQADRAPKVAVNDKDDLLALIARLYYMENMDQAEVARLVGISRSQISRLLQQARERGIVRISIDPYEPRAADLEAELMRIYGLNRVVVIHTLAATTGPQIRRTIGCFAGPVVSEWIKPGSIVGFAGGRTIAEVIARLSPLSTAPGITAVQLMGNIEPEMTAIDAMELARVVAHRFGGAHFALSAPAFVDHQGLRDAFMGHDHMRLIWRLFGMMEQAFVGVGTLADSVFVDRAVVKETDLRKLSDLGAVGEICGRFYDAAGQECASEYRDRVISISLSELRSVPEVIGVTHGSERAPAIIAAINSGLLKSLVVDEAAARALLNQGTNR